MFYFHHRLTSLNISRHISIVINFAPSSHGLVGLIFLDFQILMRKFSPKYLCSFVLLKICSGEVHINVMPFHIYCDYTRGKLKLAQRRRKEKFILNWFRKSYPIPNEACKNYMWIFCWLPNFASKIFVFKRQNLGENLKQVEEGINRHRRM